MNRHKKKCDMLKGIRKGIADKLGVNLHRVECTYDGDCKGTCPKCKQEEEILNKALLKKVGTIAAGTTAGLMLTACTPGEPIDGDYMGIVGPNIKGTESSEIEENGDLSNIELSGDVVYIPNEEDSGENVNKESDKTEDCDNTSIILERTSGVLPYDPMGD